MAAYARFSFGLGFGVWLLGTILFRLAGQHFFLTDQGLILFLFYAGAGLGLYLLAQVVMRRFQLDQALAVRAGVLMALPGMFMDTLVILFFSFVMPNMPESSIGPFSSWLMWVYAIVLLAGLLYRKG